MNDQTKKVLLIALAVVAVGLAGFSAYKFATGDQMQVDRVIHLPPGTKSMRDQEVESMQGKGAPVGGGGKARDVAGGDALTGTPAGGGNGLSGKAGDEAGGG